MALLAALRLLTVLPLPSRLPTSVELAAASGYFPVAGLIIGLVLAAVDALLQPLLPQPVVSALLLVVLLGITGGIHVDGLADTCDGFFSGAESPAQRLDMMRDSRVGSYGVAGVVSLLLVQYAAIASLPAGARAVALVLVVTLSRWAMTFALVAFPHARADGMGASFQPHSRRFTVLVATLFTGAVSVLLAGLTGALLLAVVWVVTWLVARALMSRLPGLTGDTYGAINEVVQALVLLLLLAVPVGA